MADKELRNRLKLIEILKKYTDEDHPITQKGIRAIDGADELMGYKNSFTRRLFEIAEAYNTDIDGSLLDEKDWKIVYPGYKERKEHPEQSGIRNRKIYYNHSIEKHELDFLIHSIRKAEVFSEKEKKSLEKRLINEMASVHYSYEEQDIVKSLIHHFNDKDKAITERNLSILSSAISQNAMISFSMLGIDKNGEVFRKKEREYIVSPYMIVSYDGKFWLLANCQREYISMESNFVNFSSGVTVYRIDRMCNIGIETKTVRTQKNRPARFPYGTEEKVKLWDKQVAYLHKEEWAAGGTVKEAPCYSFRIIWKSFPEKERKDYSFVYDAFGDTFSVKGDVVYVKASPSFFEEWVMRYGNKVVITDDTDASKYMKKRIQNLLLDIQKLYT